MIILDLRSIIQISKIEKLKVILHVLKVCVIFKLELRLQNNSRSTNLTIWKTNSSLSSKFIIIMKPDTRLIISNINKLITYCSLVTKPTIMISRLIYQHKNNELHNIYLPKVSSFVIDKINYINETQIIAGIANREDVEQFINFNKNNVNRIVDFNKNVKYDNFDIPIKVINKRHKFVHIGLESINNFDTSGLDKLKEVSNISVIIPTTLNIIQKHFKFTSLLSQVSNLLISTQINFEIILVVGPEVNSFELSELMKNYPEIIVVKDASKFNFSRRVNKGLAAAKNEFIWILNDDVRISSHNSAGEDLLIAIQLASDQSTGIIGTFLMEGGVINHAGFQIYNETADHVLRGSQFSNTEAMNSFRVREVTGVTGANICFLKKTIEKLGNFDETFPLEYSDVELCLRANNNNLQNYVIRTRNFTHFESSTRKYSLDPRHQLLRTLAKYNIDYKDDPYKFTIPYCCLQELSDTNLNLYEIDNNELLKK